MPDKSNAHAQRGMSLLELFFTLAIITILTTLALPVFSMLEQEESSRVLRQFLNLVDSARSAAIRQGRTITLCPSDEHHNCAGDWQYGAMIFIDDDANRQRDNNEEAITLVQWRDMKGELSWRAFGNRQRLLIDRYGGLTGQNGNLTWCPPEHSAVPAHQLVLNGSGRFRFARDSDGDGYRENSGGDPLRCS
ncbi:MAG: GspH/FimT family pseudopilin [Pseudohongiella sp.]|uniref:GspH/FimT family pseudopilin n=1 Tax=Pseudohongiella sp. TaxID=1979412 RepID=UPI0034A06473